MHLNKGYPGKKHHFVTKVNHRSLHLPKCNRWNFAMQTFFNLPIISRLQNLMQSLYGYSFKNPKNHLECTKLTLIMKTKDNKILWRVKTCWVSMVSLSKKSLKMLALLIKMVSNASIIALATLNLNPLCDVNCFFVLNMFHSHVGIVNSLVKFVELYDFFVWICCNIEYLSNWSQVVCRPHFGFQWLFFGGFYGLVETNHDDICIKQIINLNTKIYHLRFEFNG
jgi:hypothetical protein